MKINRLELAFEFHRLAGQPDHQRAFFRVSSFFSFFSLYKIDISYAQTIFISRILNNHSSFLNSKKIRSKQSFLKPEQKQLQFESTRYQLKILNGSSITKSSRFSINL